MDRAAPEVVAPKQTKAEVLRECVLSDLAYRLKDGKQVCGVSLSELLHEEFTEHPISLSRVVVILESHHSDIDSERDKFVAGVIEKFLNCPRCEDLIEEKVAEYDDEGPDEMDLSRAHRDRDL